MNVAFNENEMPLRLRFEQPLSDDALMRFSSANEWLRFERDANGELLVITPAGSDGGSTELEVGTELMLWARRDGGGKAFGPNAGFTLPDTSVLPPTRHGSPGFDGTP